MEPTDNTSEILEWVEAGRADEWTHDGCCVHSVAWSVEVPLSPVAVRSSPSVCPYRQSHDAGSGYFLPILFSWSTNNPHL